MIRTVLTDDHPTLRLESGDVTAIVPSVVALGRDLEDTALTHEPKGIGLSAIQVGVPLRVMWVKDVGVMVNPALTRTLNREAVDFEGCLSVDPRRWREVSRPAKCDVAWQDLTGARHERSFSGMLARCIQHELDHLDGILITDKPPV